MAGSSSSPTLRCAALHISPILGAIPCLGTGTFINTLTANHTHGMSRGEKKTTFLQPCTFK